jgi:hypothetical protein
MEDLTWMGSNTGILMVAIGTVMIFAGRRLLMTHPLVVVECGAFAS